MRAVEYKANFIHMIAQGYTVDEALKSILLSFFEEYNGMVGKGSGTLVYNAIKQQNDKWRAFARSLPNYNIREQGFIESLQHIKPELYKSYSAMEEIFKMMRRERKGSYGR